VNNPERDVVVQVSNMSVVVAGAYDGEMTYRELREFGDFGIGTFDGLDGEMVQLDGEIYQVRADGIAVPADDSTGAPFANLTYFEPDQIETLEGPLSCGDFFVRLDELLPSKNLFYAVRVTGKFVSLTARSVPKQTKPYPPAVEVAKTQPVFSFSDQQGTLAGFRFPGGFSGMNLQGYHFHFLSKDRQAGGHLLDCQLESAKAEIDIAYELRVLLPNVPAFLQANASEADMTKQIEAVEK
jgi:acetolactate decarboxylase